jgi:hypothetical protein
MGINVDDVIKAYIATRDEIDKMKEDHKAQLAPLDDRLRKIEMWLQNQLQSQGLNSLRGSKGTAFMQEVMNTTVEDWTSTLDAIKAKDLWPLLDRRVSKSAVQDYITEYGEPPPGVKVTRATVVRVRRG